MHSSCQVMLGRVYDGRMVDVWSTGCSLFVMLAGAFPFLQARVWRLDGDCSMPSARANQDRSHWGSCLTSEVVQLPAVVAPSVRCRVAAFVTPTGRAATAPYARM